MTFKTALEDSPTLELHVEFVRIRKYRYATNFMNEIFIGTTKHTRSLEIYGIGIQRTAELWDYRLLATLCLGYVIDIMYYIIYDIYGCMYSTIYQSFCNCLGNHWNYYP